jgi:hypothetical protein
MPLLNICAITGNNMVVQVGLAFLSGERESDYNWALDQVRGVMTEHLILEPLSIVTDRELALMNSLDTRFPRSQHILCRWHVNMNVLAKTKRFFPGPIKHTDRAYQRHPDFQGFLSDWNSLLASTTKESFEESLADMGRRHPHGAMTYVENTWLLWKEKLVAFWINQNYHFGVTVTSPIEGCHATLKTYLQRGHGDLRGVFLKLRLYWTAQHSNLEAIAASQQLRPKHSVMIPLFAAILSTVHGYALQRILQELSKLPSVGGPIPGCSCTIQRSFGLPCYHTLWERLQTGGAVLLSDIHEHWYYLRGESSTFENRIVPTVLPILDPMRIQGRGRPKGALGGISGSRRIAASSTRRELSAFELPSSSAPPVLQSFPILVVQSLPIRELRPISTTAVAKTRLQNGHVDLYEPGTRRERGYMNGIASVYRDDSDATAVAIRSIQRSVVDGIEVHTQDGEFEDDLDELA